MNTEIKNKTQIIEHLKKRLEDQILEESNFLLLEKLINQADSLDEAIAIAELGTTLKRTGFHFDKRLEKMSNDVKYLRKNEKLSFDNEDGIRHKLIIGDNYDALQQLLITHKEAIDIIYIDPPYGKDDMGSFAETNYNNAITRDNLLSMLYPRLMLARELLSDEGVIFCSIDDKNQAYVKCLFDECFGEKCCAAVLMVETASISGPRRVPAMQGSVVKTAEYVLVYVNGDDTKIMRNPKFDYIRGFDTHYSKFWNKKDNTILDFSDVLCTTDMIVDEFKKHDLDVSLNNIEKLIEVSEAAKAWLYSDEVASCVFRRGDKTSVSQDDKKLFNNKAIAKIGNKNIAKIGNAFYDIFLYVDRIGQCDDYFESYGERQIRGNLWKGFSSDGGNLGKEGGVSFKGGKKPRRLIKQLLESTETKKDGVILDFFAGSGTTGEAVSMMNEQDGGTRSFILCTNNEVTEEHPNGIAIDATYKRMKNILPRNAALDVFDICKVASFEKTKGKTPFDVIDETNYGLDKFKNIKDKIKWVCENFENTQKYLEDE